MKFKSFFASVMTVAMGAFGGGLMVGGIQAVAHQPAAIVRTVPAAPAVQYSPLYPRIELAAKTTPTTLVRYRITPARYRAMWWAEAQRGKWYCYGGTGPGCFDCSGLVMTAYEHAGFYLPRTTEEMQASYKLRRESYAEARPGDIILYGWPAFHAAMFVGHGELFQSSEPGHPIGFAPIDWSMGGGPQFYRVVGANVWYKYRRT